MNANRNQMIEAANQAAIQGQLEQAVRLLANESSAGQNGRRLAIELHDRISRALEESLAVSDWDQVVAQWRLLLELEGDSPQLLAVQKRIESQLIDWSKARFRDGSLDELDRVLHQIGGVRPAGPFLQEILFASSTVRSAKKLSSLGRYAEAEAQLQGISRDFGDGWLDACIEQLRAEHERTKHLLVEIHRAAEKKQWQDVALHAESLLVIAHRHPVAYQLGQRARAELAAMGRKAPANLLPVENRLAEQHQAEKPRPNALHLADMENAGMISAVHHPDDQHPQPSPEDASLPKAPILWIDGVGGFLLLEASEIVIGQAAPGNQVDLMVVGDLSRRAAVIRRSGEDHLLQPLQPLSVNDTKVDRATLLRDGDIVALSQRVMARYVRPNRLSVTARLEMLSRHRWQPSVDGVLLMGDSCILGPGSTSHVLCPFWTGDVVLFKHRGQWMCKSPQPMEIDGKSVTGAVALEPGKRIRGFDFSMTLE